MSSKTDVKVLIGGKIYTLSGYESEEYLQKIAAYINGKMNDMGQMPGYKRLGTDVQKILLELNLADDYHKARQRIEELETDIEEKDRIEYDLKHELIAAQVQSEGYVSEIKELKAQIAELQKQVMRYELKAGK